MENLGTMQQSEVVLSPLERRLKQNKSWSNLLPQETMDRMKKQMKNYSFLVSDRVSKESNQRNTCSSNREMIPPFNSMNNQFQFNSSPEKKELFDASPRVNQLIEQFRSQLVNKSSLHQLNQQIHDQVVHTLFEPPVSVNIRSEEFVSSVPNTNTNTGHANSVTASVSSTNEERRNQRRMANKIQQNLIREFKTDIHEFLASRSTSMPHNDSESNPTVISHLDLVSQERERNPVPTVSEELNPLYPMCVLLLKYPYGMMKKFLLPLMSHEIPNIFRLNLYSSSLKYGDLEQNTIRNDFFDNYDEQQTGTSSILLHKVVSRAMEELAKSPLFKSEMARVETRCIHRAIEYCATIIEPESIEQGLEGDLVTRTLQMGYLCIPLVWVYYERFEQREVAERLSIIVHYLNQHRLNQDLSSLLLSAVRTSIRDKDPYLYRYLYNKFARISTEDSDTENDEITCDESSEYCDLSDKEEESEEMENAEESSKMEWLMNQMLKGFLTLYVGILDRDSVIFILDQLVISQFDIKVMTALCSSILIILRIPISRCTMYSQFEKLVERNKDLVSADSLSFVFNKVFLTDLAQHFETPSLECSNVVIKGLDPWESTAIGYEMNMSEFYKRIHKGRRKRRDLTGSKKYLFQQNSDPDIGDVSILMQLAMNNDFESRESLSSQVSSFLGELPSGEEKETFDSIVVSDDSQIAQASPNSGSSIGDETEEELKEWELDMVHVWKPIFQQFETVTTLTVHTRDYLKEHLVLPSNLYHTMSCEECNGAALVDSLLMYTRANRSCLKKYDQNESDFKKMVLTALTDKLPKITYKGSTDDMLEIEFTSKEDCFGVDESPLDPSFNSSNKHDEETMLNYSVLDLMTTDSPASDMGQLRAVDVDGRTNKTTTWKINFLWTKLLAELSPSQMKEFVRERMRRLEFCWHDDQLIDYIAVRLYTKCHDMTRKRRQKEREEVGKYQTIMKRKMEKESIQLFGNMINSVMEGIEAFYSHDYEDLERRAREEKELRMIRKENVGEAHSTYEYNKISKKTRQKYDKQMEDQVKKYKKEKKKSKVFGW